ncbi:JAB domain-containing protein [Chitinimonas arctica]|uniref:JAB domain-containing protein n=1 Tax=Chitinimonas arctica TaxID=2594795 RepID=A0A516SKU4_9NEIS|nr:DNA repair protein RadC [Chitinimonas arctica]QDQ28648.1 JAB domain-containing protein [Chitinimonas arctica]
MPITDWPEKERPREKLLHQGASALSDAELLAIFLRVGLPGKSAVDLARELLTRFGSLTGLFHADQQDITAMAGLGIVSFTQLRAISEISRRLLLEELRQPQALINSRAVRDYLRLWLGGETSEAFGALFLDSQHQLLAAEILFRGTVDQAAVYPRELAKRALLRNAAAIIVAHNHPSGCTQPSTADISLTHRLQRSLALLDICLLDHFVVCSAGVSSLAELGHMAPDRLR